MTTDEKLKYFMDVTIESASNESTRLIEEYTRALNQVFEDHAADAMRKANLQIKIGADSLEREKNKELSKEQIRIKKELYNRQEELKNQLFSEVASNLEYYMSTRAYHDLLVRQIKEAKKFARQEDIIIYLDPADADQKADLEQETGTPLTVSEDSFQGGIRAIIHSKNILIDHSFETKLKEAKEAFTFINN